MKSVIMRQQINDASELVEFLGFCREAGADLSVTNVASYIKIEGEEVGTVLLIEETLSDGSTVHNIEFHS